MNKKWLKITRSIVGALFFLCITAMFLDFTGTLHHYLAWMAKVQFLPAVMALNFVVITALLLLTLLFGRIYCSVVCPLGIFQDGIAHIHNRIKKNRYTFSKAHTILRYVFLGMLVIAMLAGVNSLVALLAPYSSYGLIVQYLLSPIYQWCNNLLAALSEHYNSYMFYDKEIWLRSLSSLIIALVIFAVVVILAWRNGRTYCNTICPVGTFLSFFARFSWFKMHIDEEKCIQCGLCTKNCKSSCMDGKNGFVDYSRCISCGNCMAVCPKGAIEYTHRSKKKEEKTEVKPTDTVDTGKRAFLLGTALAVGTAAFAQEKKKVDGGLAFIEDKVAPERKIPIVPAGAHTLASFRKHCIGCQLCVSQCPNDVLRPSSDWRHLMQPEMSFERGYCRPECTACSDVCPTGAISKITKEEKSSIKKGQAKWIGRNCLVISDGVHCGNCARHCPTNAIEMKPLIPDEPDGLSIPVINESLCIGCGACEYVCPSRPLSAIYVEGVEQQRFI